MAAETAQEPRRAIGALAGVSEGRPKEEAPQTGAQAPTRRDAKRINAHDFVMTHRALAVLAVQTIGQGKTLALMRALRDEGGLPGLTGICGREPEGGTILSRAGIPEDWSDWQMPGGQA